ncbi:FAD-dependent oxidoreductase [Streptomyces sp. P3]|nr:FAD-dependent oxidoreductase [Streptomyces sp. P3]
MHFASSDHANVWAGFIDGAVESGTRVARCIRAGWEEPTPGLD